MQTFLSQYFARNSFKHVKGYI